MFVEATGDVLRERYACVEPILLARFRRMRRHLLTAVLLLCECSKLLAHPDYRAFVKTTPVIGIWDDHDFGINDAHKGYTHREESQQIFLDFMNEPMDSPRRKQEVLYIPTVAVNSFNLFIGIE